jgi:hypothetical protein
MKNWIWVLALPILAGNAFALVAADEEPLPNKAYFGKAELEGYHRLTFEGRVAKYYYDLIDTTAVEKQADETSRKQGFKTLTTKEGKNFACGALAYQEKKEPWYFCWTNLDSKGVAIPILPDPKK